MSGNERTKQPTGVWAPGRAWVMGVLAWLALASLALAQTRPYIGYAYPAGGQRGTTFQIRFGGQGLDDVDQVLITGTGVTARVIEYYRRLNPQEMQLLNEQMQALRRATSGVATAQAPAMMAMAENSMMMMAAEQTGKKSANGATNSAALQYMMRIQQRIREYVQTPACASISSLVAAEVTIAPDAEPGAREIRLATPRGVSNPLVFHVGQLREYTRKPMTTAILQTLGKEEQALRKRPTNEIEVRINAPCTVNGQVASGEVNLYRFAARRGQRLVISTQARQLIPYIADAVPGWFQPVLAVYDAKGRELLFADDFRFKPDPVLCFEAPVDGEYVFAITDSIHRGREDFVYRITVGEMPYVTSIFPLGGRVGKAASPKIRGWNLQEAVLTSPDKNQAGVQTLVARKRGIVSNPVPFMLDALPDDFDKDTNNTPAMAQQITLPVAINGRMDKPADVDVFEFAGKSNDTVVVEVMARRLESPLDSTIKLTDASGTLLAYNDDCEDLSAGVNTHHADSYFQVKLPASGNYYVHVSDAARHGGPEYGYRLRISGPQPDFELRAVPSSISLRTNSSATVTVYAQRKDGYAGPIRLEFKDPPAGVTSAPVILNGTQTVARLTIRSGLQAMKEAVDLTFVGSAKIAGKDLVRPVVPAEDRMQAFLWRHLVPATDFKLLVVDPGYQPPPRFPAPVVPAIADMTNASPTTNMAVVAKANVPTNTPAGTNAVAAAKPKFTKQQIAGRLRQLKLLFEEGLLTESFYCEKVAECNAPQ